MLQVPSILGESGIEGIGVFVTCDVKKGTPVWTFNAAVDFRRGDFPDWLSKYVFNDSNGTALDGDNARFMNHSDAPNLISSGHDLVAARDLSAWEELTVDYNHPESKMTMRTFHACLAHVPNRGTPPVSFLGELVDAILPLPDEVFAPNPRNDVYSLMAGTLGPYASLLHRKAVMAEVLRVLAGEESSWNWNEGVDTTNRSSMANVEGQETGIFQVSADSMRLAPELRAFIVDKLETDHPAAFIAAMKENHALAVEYAARLLRVSYAWDGPLRRGVVGQAVSHAAVTEFEGFLIPTRGGVDGPVE